MKNTAVIPRLTNNELHKQPGIELRKQNMAAPMQESPIGGNPATPSDHPENAHENQRVMAEIDLDNGQVGAEQGGPAATDLKLASEQTAMQGLRGYQATAHAAAAVARKGVALPPLQLYSADNPFLEKKYKLSSISRQFDRLDEFETAVLEQLP